MTFNCMKKILITFLLTASFSTFADLDFSLSDFCYLQPEVQDRDVSDELHPDYFNAYEYLNPFGNHYYDSGTYYFPNEEVGITETSICVFKDEYGQYDSKGNLKNGKKEGKWIHWHRNGQKWLEVNWKDGNKDGKLIWWYKNGQISIKGNLKDDKRIGKWIQYLPNGQIESEAIFKDGECVSGDCD